MSVYEPSDDSFLLSETIKCLGVYGDIFEVGVGSGIQLENLKSNKNVYSLSGCDIDKESIALCKKKNLNCFYSDLFQDVSGKFDFIIFNPPYLPEDEREPMDSRRATTGGRKGGEIINRFLEEAKNHLKENGKIILLTSSLTKGIKWKGYRKKLLNRLKIYFEELYVWELNKRK